MNESKLKIFEEKIKNRWEEKTVKEYVRWVRKFLMSGFDEDDAEVLYLWDDSLYKEGYSYNSRLVALSAVKLYQRFVAGIRKSDLPEVHEVARGSPPEFKPKYVDISVVSKIFEEPRKLAEKEVRPWKEEVVFQHEAMLKLGYNLILRAVELLRIRRDDVDLREGTVFIRAAKGSISRKVEIDDLTRFGIEEDPSTFECIRELMKSRSNYLFLAYGKTRPWSSISWRNEFLRLYGRKYETNWHAFARHSPIIHRLQLGESFEDVWLRARHKNPIMTARYAAFVGRKAPRFMGGN